MRTPEQYIPYEMHNGIQHLIVSYNILKLETAYL